MNHRMVTFFCMFGILTGCAHSGNLKPSPDEAKQTCPPDGCTEPYSFDLIGDDGKTLSFSFKSRPPIVQGNFISIFPGETTHVLADVSGAELTNFRTTKQVEHPSRTLTFQFSQEEFEKGERLMLLTITNPFDRAIKFRAGMMLPSSDRLMKTSVCPLMPNGKNFESWPEPIFQIVLTDFHFLDKLKESQACE